MRKRRVSAQRRDQLLEEFERSGMSATAFARKHKINYTTFCSWRKRRLQAEKKNQPTLVELKLDRPSEVILEVFLGSQCRMTLTSASQARIVATIIRELEATGC